MMCRNLGIITRHPLRQMWQMLFQSVQFLEAQMLRYLRQILLIVTLLAFSTPSIANAQQVTQNEDLTLADLQNLVDSLKIVKYTKPATPQNAMFCTATGLLAQQVIRRIISEGITTDPAIQDAAKAQWPMVETKVGMTWMAICTGGNLQ